MLVTICGGDQENSRKYFIDLKKQYEEKGYFVSDLKPQNILEIDKGLSESATLFDGRVNWNKVFFSENVDKELKKVRRLDSHPLYKILLKISQTKNYDLILWENKSLYEIKLKKLGKVKEFKPPANIFKLNDACYPGNKNLFYHYLETLSQSSDQQFIFLMLIRHVRQLILAISQKLPANLPPWQKSKLLSQAKKWQTENLISFYQGLHRAEIGLKSGESFYDLKNSLDILTCYLL